jgi:hypothetical protein
MLLGFQLARDHERVGEGISDIYFSADVETDGPIPGPYSILSFAIVYAGAFDGRKFSRPANYDRFFYRELKPISESFQKEALEVNGLDRARLCVEGMAPETAMTEAFDWINLSANAGKPVLVASGAQPKVVTGVCNTPAGPRVPNRLHLKIKNGFDALAKTQNLFEEEKVLRPLLGRLEAAAQIDPKFKARAKTLRAKYSRQRVAIELA